MSVSGPRAYYPRLRLGPLASAALFLYLVAAPAAALETIAKQAILMDAETGTVLFEKDAEGQLSYVHQPFVAPLEEDIPLLDSEPERVRGTHYDVVINGVELGSGSLRNHRADVQLRILELMGYSKQKAIDSFGFLLEALETGAPPHGGFAFGFDRWVMVMAKAESLRDVIPFPKTQRGQDLLMQAPSVVE
ncbi:MAG: hypothetical protein IH807_06655, partial [Proteobacteria bacterium]|nr:hypothetical protein [Pseudomonadota bacterium]